MQRFPSQYQMCEEHNLPKDILIKPDKLKQELKQVCRLCSDIFYGIISAQSVKDLNKGLIQSFESQAKTNLNCMNQIITSLMSVRDGLNKKVESLINEIRNQIQNQEDILKQCYNQIFQCKAIKQLHEKYIQDLNIFQNITIKEFQLLQQNYNFNQNIGLLQKLDLDILKEQSAQLQTKIRDISQNFFQSQIKVQDKDNENIKAVASNRDVSLVAVGYDKNMKIYQFWNEQLKEILHQEEIANCLKFIKGNQLILGGVNIYILQQQNDQQWIAAGSQHIGRSRVVVCFIINSNQDQLIFVDCDWSQITRVNFLKLHKDNVWIPNQKVELKVEDQVYSLSLNDSNTKLISSVKSQKVFLWENEGNEWLITQQIHVEQYGFRLCFISESEFVFLPYCSENLRLYSFNNPKQMCQKVNQFQIKNGKQDCEGFPIQFIKSRNLLVVKNKNSTFILDQSIEFKNYFIQGCVSDDDLYLFAQEKDSKELQVKKLIIMQ